MKNLCLSVFLILGVVVLSLPAFAQSDYIQPVFTLQTPQVGQQLRGGSHVTIAFDLVLDKSILDNPWAEMELFLVDDHALSMRITPELGIRARTFEWIVPPVNTRSARLVL